MNFSVEDMLLMMEKVSSLGLECFEYQDKDVRMKIRGQKRADVMAQNDMVPSEMPVSVKLTETKACTDHVMKAPMVGTFYAAPSEGAEPFISVGDTVKKGQIIGIIEAMKLMNEIEADADGIVEEILVSNESLVEYGQPLMRICVK